LKVAQLFHLLLVLPLLYLLGMPCPNHCHSLSWAPLQDLSDCTVVSFCTVSVERAGGKITRAHLDAVFLALGKLKRRDLSHLCRQCCNLNGTQVLLCSAECWVGMKSTSIGWCSISKHCPALTNMHAAVIVLVG
jgi:hypothetical protein